MHQGYLKKEYETREYCPGIYDGKSYETFLNKDEKAVNGRDSWCDYFTDVSSVFPVHFVIPTETSFPKGVSEKLNELKNLISDTIDRIMQSNDVFKEIEKEKLLKRILKIANHSDPSIILNLSEEVLNDRMQKIMAFEALSEITSDFTDDMMKEFQRSIKRRKFFR